MVKKSLCFALVFLCFKLALAQKPMSDKAIAGLYKSIPASGLLNTSNGINYYLVKFKEPARADSKTFRFVKRVSYNFYVVASATDLSADKNIQEATPVG